MAECLDGTWFKNPKPLANGPRQLSRLDKAIARGRNAHGRSNLSNRRERLYVKRLRLHARIVNVRNDHHHKATTAIAKSAGRVVVEMLNVAGMMRNRRLAGDIADAGMAGFLVKLEYKCSWYGTGFEKADRWYASSELCAHCGWHNAQMTLSDRTLHCGGCGALVERDVNAELNLEQWPGSASRCSASGGRWSVKRQPALPLPASRQSRD